MSAYIIRRIILILFALVGVSIIISLLTMALPADYVDIMLGTEQRTLTETQIQSLRSLYDLDDSWFERYQRWIISIFQGTMGHSLRTRRPVSTEILMRLPVSLELALGATIIGLIIGVLLGVLSAIYREGLSDFLIRIFGLTGLSIPPFWLGLMVILGLALFFNWTPPRGRAINILADPIGNFKQFIFPVLVLSVAMAAALMRISRSAMLEVLQSDYVRTARSKGLTERVVLLKHCLKNAFIPILTLASMQMAYLIGGTVVIESVFSLNGIGILLLNAVNTRDYALVQGVVLVITFFFAFINLITDLIYGFLDPRIRYE